MIKPCLARSALLAGTIVLVTHPASAGGPNSAYYSRGSEALLWFVHVTDLHIGSSTIQGPYAPEHLELALSEAVPVIAPSFVVASGDLTDGSLNGIPYLGQDPADWALYRQIVDGAGMTADRYFDLPGNHDGYGDIGLGSFLANSVQGEATGQLYGSWERTDSLGGRYVFFGLNSAGDGCAALHAQEPEFTADEIAWLDSSLASAADAELVVVFAHHPIDEPPGGDAIAASLESFGGAFYVHGHVHSYQEYIVGTPTVVSNQLGTLGQGDGDNIGVGVIDHNAFIYRATSTESLWPLIVITAPVDTKLRNSEVPNPWAYEVCKNRPDNPIRALVFSAEAPDGVTATVAGLAPVELSLAGGSTSLWQGELDTSAVPSGDVELTVTARIGASTYSETIRPRFASGDCPPLPDDGQATGGAGGSEPVGGGGSTAAGGAGGGGAPIPYVPSSGSSAEDGGCGCRVGRVAPRRSALPWACGTLWALGLRRRLRPRCARG